MLWLTQGFLMEERNKYNKNDISLKNDVALFSRALLNFRGAMNLFKQVAHVHSWAKETGSPDQFFPEQIQTKGQDRVHDSLWVVETYVADQRTGQHLLFIHVLQQVLQIIDDGSHIVLSGHLERDQR